MVPGAQVNVPKTKRAFCKNKACKKHTAHKVTQYKTGKASLYAQGAHRARSRPSPCFCLCEAFTSLPQQLFKDQPQANKRRFCSMWHRDESRPRISCDVG